MGLSIQERLKDLRVEHGLTLEQLAEQTHLSKSALGSYEGGTISRTSATMSLSSWRSFMKCPLIICKAFRQISMSAFLFFSKMHFLTYFIFLLPY